jgi:hypothetical protein
MSFRHLAHGGTLVFVAALDLLVSVWDTDESVVVAVVVDDNNSC